MKKNTPLPLFVYGTLSYDRTVRAITGRIFPKRPGVLDGFVRIAPQHGYAYIVPQRGSLVEGYLLDGVDERHFRLFDKYEAEGDMYNRVEVTVTTPGGEIRAYAYVANLRRLGHYFAPEAVGLRYAEVLDGLVARGADGQAFSPEEAAARRELLAGAIEEMLESREQLSPLPESEIRRIFLSPGIPSLEKVRASPEMRQYADAYMLLAIRHIIFNQLEDKMAQCFRDTVASSRGYYGHAASDLLALRYANGRREEIDRLINEMECGRLREDLDYTDFALFGVRIAGLLFERDEAQALCRWLGAHRHPGIVPLGAELEFSPLGVRAIGARPGDDPEYDGFYYFHDFDLLRRGWKLGMYVDNHRAVIMPGERSRGFLEYALGRCRIHEDISKPVTNDPWLLAMLVREAAAFCRIQPHSLHISLQLPPGKACGPIGPASDLLCLLILGGDLREDGGGVMREMRLHQREIEDENGGIYFSKENVHFSDDGTRTTVMEYQFPRLSLDRDYLPLVMALKGFQCSDNPPGVNPFMDGAAYRPDHPLLMELKRWAESPRPLDGGQIARFLERIERGLKTEDSGKPAHGMSFMTQCLSDIQHALKAANASLHK